MKKNIKISIALLLAGAFSLNASVDLDTVVVTSATKSPQSIKDITSNVDVITNEEIEEKKTTSLVDLLDNLPGIEITRNGGIGATSTLYLRGMATNRVLFLIDGIRYNDPSSTTGAKIQHLMTSDIKKVEVIKGAQSGVWGADAAAGVINIITKEPKSGNHTSFLIEDGSFGTKRGELSISTKKDRYDAKLTFSRLISDSFSVQAPYGEDINKYENDPYENTTIHFLTNFYIDKSSKIKFNIVDIDSLKDYDSYGNPNDDTKKSDVNSKLYSLEYQKNIQNHNIKLKAQKSRFKREEIGTVAQFGMQFVKNFEGTHKNFELNDDIKYNKDDFLLIGTGKSSDKVFYILTNNTCNTKTNKDKYIYLTNYNKLQGYSITESLRYDDYDNFDSKFTGKFGVKKDINQDLYLSANIGTAYNVPNIMQELNPWGAVNSDLNPENSKSYDISLGYKDFKITYFYNRVKDLIAWYDPDGFGGVPGIYKNLDGISTFKGAEVSYTKDIRDNLLVSLNYTKLSAKDKEGKDLARRANEELKVGFDLYPINQLHVGLNAQYVGDRYDQADKKGRQTGRYTVMNFVSNYQYNKNLEFYLKIDNITNKYYQTIDGYSSSPRAYYVGMKGSF